MTFHQTHDAVFSNSVNGWGQVLSSAGELAFNSDLKSPVCPSINEIRDGSIKRP